MKKNLLAFLILFITINGFSQNISYVWYHGGDAASNGQATDVIAKPDNTLLVCYTAGGFDVDPSQYDQITGGCIVAKYDQQRRLQWYVSMGGTPSKMTLDKLGNIYIYGTDNQSFDAEPGLGVTTLTPSPQSSGYVIELDSTGQFIWAWVLNCYQSNIRSISFDDNNQPYIYGTFRGTLDTDPDTAVVNNITSGAGGVGTDPYILKLSSTKSLMTCAHFSGFTDAGQIYIENNIVYTSGQVPAAANFNPLGVTSTLNSAGGPKAFVARYDTSLILINAALWPGQYDPIISSAGTGKLFVAGGYYTTFDADPSPAVNMTTTNGSFVINLDTALNYNWCFSYGGTNNSIKKVIKTPLGKIIVVGAYAGSQDLDPGTGILTLNSVSTDEFIGLYDSIGNFITAASVNIGAYGVALGGEQRIFFASSLMGTADLDPGTGVVQYQTVGTFGKPLLVEYSLCQPVYTTISPVICKDVGYTFGDSTFNQTGTHQWVYHPAGRCDSIVTLNLTVHQPDTRFICTDDTLTCFNNTGTTFQWLDCTHNAIVAGQTHSYYFPTDNDSYSAIISSGGCTDTTQCVQRLQGSNSGSPLLAWGSYWRGGAGIGKDRPLITDQYGNFYVGGSFYNTPLYTDLWSGNSTIPTSGPSEDAFIAKYNNDGIFQWAYYFGTTGTGGEDDIVTSIAVDEIGNLYATGYYMKATDFDPNENSSFIVPSISSATSCCQGTAFILKLNPAGQFLWVKGIGLEGRYVNPNSIAVAPNGNIAIGGDMDIDNIDFDPGPGTAILNGGGFFAEYDNSGNYIGGIAVQQPSSVGETECTSVIFDKQSNLIVTGVISASTDFDPSPSVTTIAASSTNTHYFLAKYSPNFNLIWANQIGSIASFSYPKVTLQTDCDNTIYVMKYSKLYKYTPAGVFSFAYPLSATSPSTQSVAFDLDKEGNAYITELVSGTVTLESGNTLSTGGIYKKLVAKYNKDGTNAWGFLIADATYEQSVGIAQDEKGNVFLAGAGTTTPFDIDPSVNTYNLSTSGSYIAKYGTTCSAIDTSSSITNGSTLMHVTSNAYYVWKSCANGAINSEGLVPQFSPDSSGYYYCVINMGNCKDSSSCKHLLQNPSVNVNEHRSDFGASIYPNPFTSQTTITFGEEQKNTSIYITDVVGKEIKSINFSGKQCTIEKGTMKAGSYFIRIEDENKNIVNRKVVVE